MALVFGVGAQLCSYRLGDIDPLIRRTLVYSVSILALTLLYFGSVGAAASETGEPAHINLWIPSSRKP